MSISKYPSNICLPQDNKHWKSVYDFLIDQFPSIAPEIWQARIHEGKVHWRNGDLISMNTDYHAQKTVCYYREVIQESIIPFKEKILYQDKHILVADKPHFLPVTPGGAYINECLQNRLRKATGIDELQALHRLDRDTAGLVLFSKNLETRAEYHKLFSQREIKKYYHAIAEISSQFDLKESIEGKEWHIKNRLIKSTPSFVMQIDKDAEKEDSNSESIVRCIKQKGNKAIFELEPITGKTHQLRVHMQSIGLPILNDTFYPELQPKTKNSYSDPLQLLAHSLSFIDPISKKQRTFSSLYNLAYE